MDVELCSSLWLEHPGRDSAHFTVGTDDGDDLLPAAGHVALPDSDDLPVIRVIAIKDLDFLAVL